MKAISISGTRRTLGAILATALCAALMLPSAAFAITADEAANQNVNHDPAIENVGDTQYWLTISEDGSGDPDGPGGLGHMSIDVPVKVTLALDSEGNFVTPTALKNVIENDSEFPVNLKAMSLTAKDGFTLKAATGFDADDTDNIFHGKIMSAQLNDAGDAVESTLQEVAFTKLGNFAKNAAWGMESSNGVEKAGDDCLFIQIDGEIGNVSGKYFTAPINVFDITYTFEATSADLPGVAASITD